MPYRIDVRAADDAAVERLIDLGALDVESSAAGVAAVMPDSVVLERVARALGVETVTASPAIGRDEDSVWLLRPRPFRAGRLEFVPAGSDGAADAIRLVDAHVFGTGLHPTTSLCLDAIDDALTPKTPEEMLDVGTGSGILALAALKLGVPRVVAIDIDAEAVRVALENARVNGVGDRLAVTRGGLETIDAIFPLVVANILAAPLVDMASDLARRVAHQGRLVLSGIPSAVAPDIDRAYRRLGMQRVTAYTRAGWVAPVYQASW